MEHLFKGYAIAKIEYGGWGDSHSVITGALFKIFPTRTDSYSGMGGVTDWGDIYENPEDFGLGEDWDEKDVDDVLDEEINSWIDYWAVPEDEDKEYL